MEKILFDGTFYQGNTSFHGGGEYGKAVLERLLTRDGIEEYCGIFFLKNIPICGEIYDICKGKKIKIHVCTSMRNVPYIVKKNGYTTIYSAIPYRDWGKIKLPDDVRFVCSFHGLRQIELAEYETHELVFYGNQKEKLDCNYLYRFTNLDNFQDYVQLYKETLTASKNMKIITGSQHTKYSIYNYFPELQDLDIEVLHDPMKIQNLNLDKKSENQILKDVGVESQNYGLIISAGIWYKNGLRGILAYDEIYDRGYKFVPNNFKTVILGVKNKEKIVERLKHPERFVFLGYVESETLEVLYKNAYLFLFLSLSEGYGYPALEAMKYGTLCICSVSTSIPEVCRDMVLYVNPFSIDEICNRILQSFSKDIRNGKKQIIERDFHLVKELQDKALNRIVDIICGEG